MKTILLPGMALIAVCYAFSRFAFGLFLPEISQEFGIDSAAAGLIQSASYIAYALGLLSSSYMLRSAGTRRTVMATALLAIAGLMVLALSSGPYVLAAGLFAAGISTGWASPALGQLVSETVDHNRQDGMNAWINSGTSIGIALSGPSALLFAGYWRGAYLLFALLGLAVAFALRKAVAADSGAAAAPRYSLREARRAGALLPAALLTGAGCAVYWTYFMSYLQESQGLSARSAALYWVVIGTAGIAGGLSGRTIRRIGLRRAYTAGIVGLVGSIAIVPLAVPFSNLLSAALFGAAYIFMTGLFILWGTRSSEASAAQIGLAFLALGIGQAAGTWLAGQLAEKAGYDAAFFTFSIIVAVALAFRPPIRNSRHLSSRRGRPNT